MEIKWIQIFEAKKYQKKMHHILSLVVLDSVIRVSKKYYPDILLEECKYETKNTKMENLINDDLDLSSYDWWNWYWIWQWVKWLIC